MSHIPRLFVDQPLQAGHDIGLPDAQSKYLLRVMRLDAGATVRAFNGQDGEWRCTLTPMGKTATLTPNVQTRAQAEGPDLTLLFAPIKRTRTDFIIEKATELGVRQIWPVYTEYTQTKRIRLDRMQSLVIEAAEQTERMDLPVLQDGAALSSVLADWDPERPLIFCDESGDAAPIETHREKLIGRGAGILIGPEGGFSPRERDLLRRQAYTVPITLGPRILRAETAVVSALTLWQSLVGDWDKSPYLPET